MIQSVISSYIRLPCTLDIFRFAPGIPFLSIPFRVFPFHSVPLRRLFRACVTVLTLRRLFRFAPLRTSASGSFHSIPLRGVLCVLCNYNNEKGNTFFYCSYLILNKTKPAAKSLAFQQRTTHNVRRLWNIWQESRT